ncbi:MAG: transposase [Cyanobacteriota bacterium]
MSVFQYEIIKRFNEYCLKDTEYSIIQPETLRRMLIKIGARVRETARKLWIECCSSYPYQDLVDLIFSRIRKIPILATV